MANRHPEAGSNSSTRKQPMPPRHWEGLPKAPAATASRKSAYVPLPPAYDDSDANEAIITSSFLAPEDLPLPGVEMRTGFAQQGLLIADMLRETFAQRRYGPARYRLHIEEPAGPSTGGGRQARQPLSLVSRKEPVPAIVCGWVDVAQKEAQVRSYGVVAQRYESRHGYPPKLTEDEYGRFLDKLMDTLFDGGFQIVHLVSDEESQPASKSVRWMRRSAGSRLSVALLVVLAFALGMNAERLAPGIQQAPTWISQAAGPLLEQGISWLAQLPSLIQVLAHYFH